jgi:cell division septation protein DedD/nucleoid DNA-binding protein
MDISVYLIELLRMHDCVIVPDLGGFVTNYRPAEMDLAGNSFNPPRKEIIFSAMLKKNDGLLATHISESEKIGYLDARLMISEFVEESQSRLENGETIVLPLIGSLKYDRNEKLIFEPELKENLLLDAYGLEGFQFPQLKHPDIFISKKPLRDKEAVRPVFNTRKVKTFAIAIPLLLALIAIPVKKEMMNNYKLFDYQISVTAPLNLKQAVTSIMDQPASELSKPASATVKPAEENKPASADIKKESVSTTPVLAIETDRKNPTESPVVTPLHEKYHIIGGCFKMKENAEKQMSHLRSEGFKSMLSQAPSGNYIVTVQSYADKNEAALALKNLRNQEPEAGYWMSVK